MHTPLPFDSLQMPRELACEFFAVFSRFEYALKVSGFLYVNRYGRAAPDWDSFAAAAILQPVPNSALAQAMDFLNREPPEVQTSAHNWQPVPLRGATPIATVLDAAQRVRHNLFHGGKHSPHSPPGRDEALVRAALEVLFGCLSQNNNLRAAYA
ncbi:hypothetical protein [Methylophilus sp. OH31]|uniref:hypothetical protein n=1 Tax=Methylophilus sp. OH31 TaxID=1387312 RepID=UPI0011DCFD2A|nr:hypothetical protein [Methylophilus sp. OH31]